MREMLVVDDDENLRLLYHDELTKAGYELITAANVEEALKQIDKATPDLVILDIVMP